MMTKMTSREQFESWFEEWFGDKPLSGWSELWCGDGYSSETIDAMWESWQASRQAVEIELPAIEDKRWYSSSNGKFREVGFYLAVRKIIISHGLRVKK